MLLCEPLERILLEWVPTRPRASSIHLVKLTFHADFFFSLIHYRPFRTKMTRGENVLFLYAGERRRGSSCVKKGGDIIKLGWRLNTRWSVTSIIYLRSHSERKRHVRRGGARRVAKRTATCEMTALQIECGLTGAAPAAAIHQTADEPLRLFKASA